MKTVDAAVGADTADTSDGFTTLGLDPQIVATLTDLGYEEPTPIQRAAIPPLLDGRDLLGQAATGTGKTAAFALPLLQAINAVEKGKRGHPSAVVLTPTRELAAQVAEAIYKYGRGLGITSLPLYGGADMRTQLRALSRGVDIVIATPGRAVDHIRRKSLVLQDVRMVVLDEADEMLDMGFADDLEQILGATPSERQTVLFSATMAPRVGEVAKRHLNNPAHITIARDTVQAGTVARVRQVAYVIPRAYKIETLGRVLEIERPASALIFCRTRTEVEELNEALRGRGYRTEALHGGMSQTQRDRVMKHFRANAVQLLIATDVAARGLDIAHLESVINYDVPTSPESYVHRIGRTGRAGREGVAITLAEPRERGYLRTLERYTKQKIEMAATPTVADLRSRRLDLTRVSLQEILQGKDFQAFHAVADSLVGGSVTMRDIAAAAIKLVHEAKGNPVENDVDIPVFDASERERPRKSDRFVKRSGGASDKFVKRSGTGTSSDKFVKRSGTSDKFVKRSDTSDKFVKREGASNFAKHRAASDTAGKRRDSADTTEKSSKYKKRHRDTQDSRTPSTFDKYAKGGRIDKKGKKSRATSGAGRGKYGR